MVIESTDKQLLRKNGVIANSDGAAMLPVTFASTTLMNIIVIESFIWLLLVLNREEMRKLKSTQNLYKIEQLEKYSFIFHFKSYFCLIEFYLPIDNSDTFVYLFTCIVQF